MANFMGLQVLDRPAVKEDLAGGQGEIVVDQIEDGRLSGAVRPDQTEDLSLLDLEADPVDGGQSPKKFNQFLRFE
jgi:hypothetical protein